MVDKVWVLLYPHQFPNVTPWVERHSIPPTRLLGPESRRDRQTCYTLRATPNPFPTFPLLQRASKRIYNEYVSRPGEKNAARIKRGEEVSLERITRAEKLHQEISVAGSSAASRGGNREAAGFSAYERPARVAYQAQEKRGRRGTS